MAEIIEPKKTRVSYSQYSTWQNCHREWKLKHLDKIRDKSIHLIFGTAVHGAVQDFLKVYYEKGYKKARFVDMEQKFEDKLFELFKKDTEIDKDGNKIFLCDKDVLSEFHEDGMKILSELRDNVKKFFKESHKLLGVEIPLEVAVRDNITYSGYMDVVTFDPESGDYIIYDLKTSTKGWSDYQKKDPTKINQLLLYKKFYSEMLGVDLNKITVEFIILKRKKPTNTDFKLIRLSRFEPSNGKPSVKKAGESFDNFINEAFDYNGKVIEENIKPNPSKNTCRFCKFADREDLCPEGYNLKHKLKGV